MSTEAEICCNPGTQKNIVTTHMAISKLNMNFTRIFYRKGIYSLAGERPEFCQFYLNGTRLECVDPDDFWIDVCFKKMVIPAGLIRKGRNVVTYKTLFRRTTNIEALYLVGDFGVRLEGNKRILDRRPERIGFKNLKEYNMPFYTGQITYHIPNDVFCSVEKCG